MEIANRFELAAWLRRLRALPHALAFFPGAPASMREVGRNVPARSLLDESYERRESVQRCFCARIERPRCFNMLRKSPSCFGRSRLCTSEPCVRPEKKHRGEERMPHTEREPRAFEARKRTL